MKKQLTVLLAVLLLTTGFPLSAAAAESAATPYNTIVPLKYEQIQEINSDLFVAGDCNYLNSDKVSLYRFDGSKILGDKKSIAFEDGWIKAETEDGWGVYSRDGVEVIAPQYEEMTISKDGVRCLVVDGEEYIRPGIWYGEVYLYDLITGEIMESRGYGAVDYAILDGSMDSDSVYDPSVRMFENGIHWTPTTGGISIYTSEGALVSEAWQEISAVCGDIIYVKNSSGLIGGIDRNGNIIVPFKYNWTFFQQKKDYPVMILVQNCDMENIFTSGTTDIYNKSGQVLDVPYGNEYICDGNLIRGYDYTNGMNYIYTGRGREIAPPVYNASYWGIDDGSYLIAGGDTPYVINLDGETVIAPGVFDYYACNYDSCYSSLTVSDDGKHVIVGKNGKYGIIEMKEYMTQPSAWAQEQAAEALKLELVSEEIQPYWKDNCTREEFCGMLIPAIEKASGKSIEELTEGKKAGSFIDCTDEDVLAATALGIVAGVGHDRFAPGFFISREQAASMMVRAATLLNLKVSNDSTDYTDTDTFDSWAVDDIKTASGILCGEDEAPLMSGMGDGSFGAFEDLTVEESMSLMLRLAKTDTD